MLLGGKCEWRWAIQIMDLEWCSDTWNNGNMVFLKINKYYIEIFNIYVYNLTINHSIFVTGYQFNLKITSMSSWIPSRLLHTLNLAIKTYSTKLVCCIEHVFCSLLMWLSTLDLVFWTGLFRIPQLLICHLFRVDWQCQTVSLLKYISHTNSLLVWLK